MQHIDNIAIHAFRGLKELELRDFSRINLFVGDNNCGKTSALEAIYAFCCPKSAERLKDISKLRESITSAINLHSPSSLDKAKWLFPFSKSIKLQPSMAIQGQINSENIDYTASYSEFYGIPELPDNLTEGRELREEKGINLKVECYSSTPKALNLFSGTTTTTIWQHTPNFNTPKPAECALNSIFVTPYAHRVSHTYARLYTEAYKSGLLETLTELLQEFDPDISGLIILSDDIVANLHIEHKKTGTAPIMTFGDGLRRALFIAMQLINAKDGVCILDEIDNSIHTSVLKETAAWIAKAAKKLNVQIFASTHSLEALDAFIDTANEDLAVYKLDQGGKLFRRYSHDMLYRIRHNRGLDVR